MKSGQLPGSFEKLSRSRRALAQPRFLLAAMALTLSGVVYLATAQTGRAPVKMTSSVTAKKSGSYSLEDLPAMVEAYGKSRQAKAVSPVTTGFGVAAIGTGQSGFNLVETDLTPNSPSDEREPAYSPNGEFIAFMSTGRDSDNDGDIDSLNSERRYHIWVMNRDGSNARQVTGLTNSDRGLAQSHPAWSPDGNQLVYVNQPGANSQLFVVNLRDTNPSTAIEQRTFFAGEKQSPVWSPSGLAIAFACKANPDRDRTVSNNFTSTQFDIFTIPPKGTFDANDINVNLVRLTGGASDPVGNTTQDLHPAYAAVNTDIVYFSSDRTAKGRLFPLNATSSTGKEVRVAEAGRRIWRMNSNGANKVQVTDPERRAYGSKYDIDDYPTASLEYEDTVKERLAFHSNTALSATDTPAPTAGDPPRPVSPDYNIWSFPLTSSDSGTGVDDSEPRIFASNYSGNELLFANPLTGAPSQFPDQPITGVEAPEGVVVQGQYVYVAARDSGQIVRFDQQTGLPAPSFGRTGISFTDTDSAPGASGMISDGFYFYVGAGLGSKSTSAIYRFDSSGNPAGALVNNVRTPLFSTGEDDLGKVSNGVEGLAFNPKDNIPYIYASVYNDDKINVYRRSTGAFVLTLVKSNLGTTAAPIPNPNAPDGPTGLTFGPDINNDGFDDLYVNASNSDDVLAYMGPNTSDITAKVGDGTQDAGTYITTIVSDSNGSLTNLNAPEGIYIGEQRAGGNYYLYTSNFLTRGDVGGQGSGDHINRYNIQVNATGLPTVTSAPTAGLEDPTINNDATWLRFTGAQGVGYFDFNDLAKQYLAAGQLPAPTPTPTPSTTALETDGEALVLTNILSSAENYKLSGISKSVPSGGVDNVGEDKANDLEPNFSRNASSAVLAARLVFASTRRYAPLPSSNTRDSQGNSPAPSNPYGYNASTGAQGTFDIWGTTSQDTTPPALIPQSAQGVSYPVVAPGPQAPFNAPRTPSEGLKASTSATPEYVEVAVVLRDIESGIDTGSIPGGFKADGTNVSVTATFRQAGTEKFVGYNKPPYNPVVAVPNVKIPVRVAREERPDPIRGFDQLPLQPYDDGPPSQKGHELQAGAVAGDGIYYCAAKLKTPTAKADFFIDINVVDQANNSFVYDNIWGFSTLAFTKPTTGTPTDLFVSDYTAGQTFPLTLASSSDDTRFVKQFPVESYWLTNPGGQALMDSGGKLVVAAVSIPETFSNVDIWRTQCRGPLTPGVLDSYAPDTTPQIDPNEKTPGKDGPYTELSRKVAVSTSSVIWAAPYAGTVMTGPGTIVDAVMQTNLTEYMDKGGRLFLSGKNIAYALTNNGTTPNNFLANELAAKFTKDNEVAVNIITHTTGGFLSVYADHGGDYNDLQIPYNADGENDYSDAALNHNPHSGLSRTGAGAEPGVKIDVLSAQAGNGTTTIPAYTAGGGIVGQRIEKTRSSGVISRAVFFSFGLEAVNRKYKRVANNVPYAMDDRYLIAYEILQYFKTGGINGTVINNATNNGIANFLLKVTGASGTYLVRTDSEGKYSLIGLPSGGYTVEPALLLNGVLVPNGTAGAQTSPAGFFGGTTRSAGVTGGAITPNVNLRPIPFSPGSIQGTIVTSKGTPTNFDDDKDFPRDKSVGVPVLLRSVEKNSSVPNGGRYAALTSTDAGGNFSFSEVPAGIELEVVINPNVDDPTTSVDEGDIPIESGLRDDYGGPRTKIGRRVLPDSRHPDKVIAPNGDNFVLNDPDPAKYPDPDTGPTGNDTAADSGIPIVVPEGSPVSGLVKLNGVAFSGATVDLLTSAGQPLPAPRSTKTLADGTYVFKDVLPGTYVVRVTATVSGITVTKSSSVTQAARVDGKPDTGVTANFSLFIAKVTGQVNLNGKPVAKALVKLYYPDGSVFRPERKATTGTDGKYTLNYVPAGNYLLRASLGTASGTANITVSATKDLVAPTINLVSRSVSGSVKSRTNGAAAVPASGVVVNLLNSAGTSVGQATTDSSGNYNFAAVSPGDYSVRATYQGQTLTSAVFTVSASQTNVPALTFYLQTLAVTVVDTTGAAQANASVSLQVNGVEGQSGLTDNNGKITFSNVPAGTYTVVANFNNSAGEASVTVKAGVAASVTVKLAPNTSGTTAFAGKGKIFYISIPYEDTNGPNSNNGANRTSPATTSIQSAFTVPPFDPKTGQQNYLLQRYDALTNQMVTLNNNSSIERGVGYILQVVNKGTDLVLPSDDPTRVALRDQRFDKTYTVTLRLNPSARGSSVNGRNLIGFGFDPQRFSSVDWATANVTHPNGQTVSSIAEAEKNGWLVNQITTSRYEGDTLTTVAVDKLEPYVGYYVQTKVDGLKITFENPTP